MENKYHSCIYLRTYSPCDMSSLSILTDLLIKHNTSEKWNIQKYNLTQLYS